MIAGKDQKLFAGFAPRVIFLFDLPDDRESAERSASQDFVFS
jgi:hypothetical protein